MSYLTIAETFQSLHHTLFGTLSLQNKKEKYTSIQPQETQNWALGCSIVLLMGTYNLSSHTIFNSQTFDPSGTVGMREGQRGQIPDQTNRQ